MALARSAAAADAVAARGATPLAGDLADAALAAIFTRARCEALVNLASLGFGHAPAIVSAATAAGLDRAVFVSTTAVTTALPARSKAVRLAAEESVSSGGLAWTILRPTMIYGAAGDRNMSRLLALLASARRCRVLPVPGGGQFLQQPVHAADVADVVLSSVCTVTAGRGQALRRGRADAHGVHRAAARIAACGAVGSRARLLPWCQRGLVVTVATRWYETVQL